MFNLFCLYFLFYQFLKTHQPTYSWRLSLPPCWTWPGTRFRRGPGVESSMDTPSIIPIPLYRNWHGLKWTCRSIRVFFCWKIWNTSLTTQSRSKRRRRKGTEISPANFGWRLSKMVYRIYFVFYLFFFWISFLSPENLPMLLGFNGVTGKSVYISCFYLFIDSVHKYEYQHPDHSIYTPFINTHVFLLRFF